MSKYTPDTDMVRMRYVFNADEYNVELNQQFDRWLAEHDAEVRAKEKARILGYQLENLRIKVTAERVEDLAQKLVVAWMTQSNDRLAFEKNEREREAIVKQAEELGIMRDVYRRASDIFWGN